MCSSSRCSSSSARCCCSKERSWTCCRRKESRCPARRIRVAEQHEPGGYRKATLESQPAELRRLLSDDLAERAASRLRDCSRIFLVGTGTSFHGALAGQFMLRSAGLEAWAVRSFEFANYPPAHRDSDGLLLLNCRSWQRASLGSPDGIVQRPSRSPASTGADSPM